jgi:hypothetical protein
MRKQQSNVSVPSAQYDKKVIVLQLVMTLRRRDYGQSRLVTRSTAVPAWL